MDASDYRKLFELAQEFGVQSFRTDNIGFVEVTFYPKTVTPQPKEKDPDAPKPRKSLMDAALEPVIDEAKRPGV